MDISPGFKIEGKITNSADATPAPDLYVEAWDRDLIIDDFLGVACTDQTGSFSLQFHAAQFNELIFDRYPDVYFRIYKDNELLWDTNDQLLCNLRPGTQQVTIKIDLPLAPPEPESDVALTGSLIDPETLFQFRRSLSKVLGGFDRKYPPGAVKSLYIPFEGVTNLLDMATAVLAGEPIQKQRLREILWSFGGKIVPTRIGIRVFQLHDGDKLIGTDVEPKNQIELQDAQQHSPSPGFVSNYDNRAQLLDLSRLERVMAAAVHAADDAAELATLAGSIELALNGIDTLNQLFQLTLDQADPTDISSAFDTAQRISQSGFHPPFRGFTPGDDGTGVPGFIPGGGAPWYEWPLPDPGSPFPGIPGVPVPQVPDLDSALVEHFEECFLFSIIPEMHRLGIGFRGLIYGVGTNYIIERVLSDHACPGATITLEGQRFDGATEVRYKNELGRTIGTAPSSISSDRITFTLAEGAVSGPVWLYIPKTLRLCLTTQVVALPGVRGQLIVGKPHIVSLRLDRTCIPIGLTARMSWRVTPNDVEVSIFHELGGISTPIASGLDAIDSVSHRPTARGSHSYRLEAVNPSAVDDCNASSKSITLEVRDPAAPPFEIVGVEMTQAIQIYDLTDPGATTNNSLELIENMDTVLRVYVRAMSTRVTDITGMVELNGIDYAPINDVSGVANPIIRADNNPLRSEINHSLNFLIPAANAGGTDLAARIRLVSATNPCVNPVVFHEQRISWVYRTPFPITVRIVANSDGTQMTREDTMTFVDAMLYKLPTPKTAIAFHPGVFQINRGTTEDNYCHDGGFYQLALSIAYEHNDNEGYPPASHSSSWLGLVTPNTCTPDGMMAWPSTSTCLSTQDINTAAHEVMHTVGLGHTITNNGEGCWEGPAFTGGADTQPVDCHRLEGRPTGLLDQVPFDVRNNLVVTSAFDLMSYRDSADQWLSPELWVLGRNLMDTRY